MSAAVDLHASALDARRMLAGELAAPEQQRLLAHAAECAVCQAKLDAAREEQAEFKREISFDRFAAGVERAARTRKAQRPAVRWAAPALALAASLVAVVALGPGLFESPARNRVKGGADLELAIANAQGTAQRSGPQGRAAALLSAGDRVRIGVRPGNHRYIAVVSIDQRGEVTPIYPERGSSLGIQSGEAMVYLPESLEFTGEGAERLIVVLTEDPLEVQRLVAAARAAFEAAQGELASVRNLAVPGEQFHRMVQKP